MTRSSPDTTAPPETTTDDFFGGRLSILQPRVGYRSGLDAVLLAASVPVHAEAPRILDAGAGVGVVGLGVAARVPFATVTLVEIAPGLAELARQNIRRNGLAPRADLVELDIARGGAALHDPGRPASIGPGLFDHVLANPPFHVEGTGTRPGDARRAVAHQMPAEGLARWIAFLATAARSGGTLSLIHRAEALGDLLAALAGRFGRARVLPVHPRRDQPARRILIEAVKGSRAPLAILPGLCLQDDTGRYLPHIDAILRGNANLTISDTMVTTTAIGH
ncbi:MAG: methyltransferase [Hyphomicrobiaceae bacterium]|nr:methyltransferase [Hyphomicrobiaceae bacterium]